MSLIDYRNRPLGTSVNGGVIELCPVCGERGLVTKRDAVDGVVVLDFLHWIESYIVPDGKLGVLGVRELTHYSLEPDAKAPQQSVPSSPRRS